MGLNQFDAQRVLLLSFHESGSGGSLGKEVGHADDKNLLRHQRGGWHNICHWGSARPPLDRGSLQSRDGYLDDKPDLATPRGWLCISVVNGKIYAIGGGTSSGQSTPLLEGVVEEYNWLLAPRHTPQAMDVEGKLFDLWGRLKVTN